MRKKSNVWNSSEQNIRAYKGFQVERRGYLLFTRHSRTSSQDHPHKYEEADITRVHLHLRVHLLMGFGHQRCFKLAAGLFVRHINALYIIKGSPFFFKFGF